MVHTVIHAQLKKEEKERKKNQLWEKEPLTNVATKDSPYLLFPFDGTKSRSLLVCAHAKTSPLVLAASTTLAAYAVLHE